MIGMVLVTHGCLATEFRSALEHVVGDMIHLTSHARSEFPGMPVILFGHSMGSLIAQRVLATQGELYRAAVLCGSLSVDVLAPVKPMIDDAVRQAGRDASAEALQGAMFASLMQGFANPRTPFDWLSRDAQEVDKYIADPCCGFALTLGSWQDVAQSAAADRKRGNATDVVVLTGFRRLRECVTKV